MSDNIQTRLDALKLMREWSSGVTLVQSAALGVVANAIPPAPSIFLWCLLLPLCACLIISIVYGAGAVAGTIPHVAMRLGENPACDLYQQTGGMGGPPLGVLCQRQSWFFTYSLILFMAFFAAKAYGL